VLHCCQVPERFDGKFVEKILPNVKKFCIFSKNIYFGRFFAAFVQKTVAVRPPNSPGQSLLSKAGFELFCRIFGRLATVQQ
jgi:hypothetical protein